MSEQVKECMDLEHCVHWLHLLGAHSPGTPCPPRGKPVACEACGSPAHLDSACVALRALLNQQNNRTLVGASSR
jgi:hypothetical protein